MLIERLRPNPDPVELAELYRWPNNADRWREHKLRVDITVDLAASRWPEPLLVVDPAAGAGRTGRELVLAGGGTLVTGDLSTEADVDYPGRTADDLLGWWADEADAGVRRRADVIVLGEILEHVEDPAQLLRYAAAAGTGLVLSTPLEEEPGVNVEHVWRWDRPGIEHLLAEAGWRPLDYVELAVELPHWPAGYRCQIHTAEVVR